MKLEDPGAVVVVAFVAADKSYSVGGIATEIGPIDITLRGLTEEEFSEIAPYEILKTGEFIELPTGSEFMIARDKILFIASLGDEYSEDYLNESTK